MMQTNSTSSLAQQVSAQRSCQINRTHAGIQALHFGTVDDAADGQVLCCCRIGISSPKQEQNSVGGKQDVEQIPDAWRAAQTCEGDELQHQDIWMLDPHGWEDGSNPNLSRFKS